MLRCVCVAQKFPPYDEFTSFGKPCNNPDGKDSSRVRECMTLDADPVQPLRKDLVQPPKGLVKDIEHLEKRLYMGWRPIERSEPMPRPTTGKLTPRVSPRGTYGALSSARPSSTASPRRPIGSVDAYRNAGYDPHGWPMLQSTKDQLEKWRTYPKSEEQMLLGHLKAQTLSKGNQAPLWKLKRFEQVSPRLQM